MADNKTNTARPMEAPRMARPMEVPMARPMIKHDTRLVGSSSD